MRYAKKTWRYFLWLAVVATLLIDGCSPEQPDYPRRQMPEGLMTDRQQRLAGHDLFGDKCATCHGKPSEGRSGRADFFSPRASDFSEAHYREIDPAYLFWRIEVGKTVEPYLSSGSVMPAWRGLTDREIWQLVAYLKSRSE
jgi:mono/diheme cytochrome c family protein